MNKCRDIKLLSVNNEKSLIDDAYIILQNNLGKNYIDFDSFWFYVKNNQVLVSINKKEIVGVLIIELTTQENFFNKYNIKGNVNNCRILNIQTIAVKYYKQGIGTALINYCISNYSKYVNIIFTPLWKSINGTNASRLFQKFGFIPFTIINNFWYKDSLGKEGYCPICGSPCTCSVVIYYKVVN